MEELENIDEDIFEREVNEDEEITEVSIKPLEEDNYEISDENI